MIYFVANVIVKIIIKVKCGQRYIISACTRARLCYDTGDVPTKTYKPMYCEVDCM